MTRLALFAASTLLLSGALASGAHASERSPALRAADVDRAARQVETRSGGRGVGRTGWGLDVRAAWLHVFDTQLDAGGDFAADRFALQAGISYSPRPGLPLTVSIGYRYDGYDFDGGALGAASPWEDIHSLRASIPIFAPLGERFFLLAVPVVRTTIEDGAAWDDGVTWGGFGGIGFRVNDRLSIGPGVGYLTEIEDGGSVFPIVLVQWKITPNLSLETGRGLGATQGPGVFLHWKPSSRWQVSLGGRYERLRFRLADRGPAPGGVGEDKSFGVVLAGRYQAGRRVYVSGSIGLGFLGEMRLEDAQGDLVDKDEYEVSFLAGLGLTVEL